MEHVPQRGALSEKNKKVGGVERRRRFFDMTDLPLSSGHRGAQVEFSAVFGNCPAGDLDTLPRQKVCQLLVTEGMLRILLADQSQQAQFHSLLGGPLTAQRVVEKITQWVCALRALDVFFPGGP